MGLLVNLCPCLQPGNGKRPINHIKRKKNLKPARERLGKVVLCLDEACKGDGKEATRDVQTHGRDHGTTLRTTSPKPCLLSEEASCHLAHRGC